MKIGVWLKSIFQKSGVRAGFSTKKAFDPHGQKRVDPIKEMVEKDNKKGENNAD